MGNNNIKIYSTCNFELLHDRILEYNDVDPAKLNKKELASLPEECIIKLFNKYPVITYSQKDSCNLKRTLNITPFILQNCANLAKLSVVKYHLHKYPEIACLDIYFDKDDQNITPNKQLKDVYFKCPDFPWNHLETYRKYPEWFEDKN